MNEPLKAIGGISYEGLAALNCGLTIQGRLNLAANANIQRHQINQRAEARAKVMVAHMIRERLYGELLDIAERLKYHAKASAQPHNAEAIDKLCKRLDNFRESIAI